MACVDFSSEKSVKNAVVVTSAAEFVFGMLAQVALSGTSPVLAFLAYFGTVFSHRLSLIGYIVFTPLGLIIDCLRLVVFAEDLSVKTIYANLLVYGIIVYCFLIPVKIFNMYLCWVLQNLCGGEPVSLRGVLSGYETLGDDGPAPVGGSDLENASTASNYSPVGGSSPGAAAGSGGGGYQSGGVAII